MTDTETSVLQLTEVAQLLSDADARRREDAGMRRADLIAPAGSYARIAPRLINLEPATPGADRYKKDLSKAIENYDSIHRLVFTDAIVTGQGTVVTRSSLLLHDSCWEMLANRITPAGLKYGADGNLAMANKPSRRIERPSLLVKRPWWRNYGHWLVDSAAQLALVPGVMMPSDWQIVIGAYDDPAMRRIVQETLALLAPGIPVIEHADHETWVFSELHFIPPVSRPGLFKLPQGLAALRARILPLGRPRSDNKRFYISRGTDGKRRLINNDAIVKLCVDRGFTIVEPENYSLEEQARLFQGAEIIVGVKGAALSNLIFATSSCAVVVLTPLGWGDTFFWDIAALLSG